MSSTAAVTNGIIENNSITSTSVDTTGSSTLGKDAFLQLLVAQMQYQDPLEPTSDTEWISQLAQFSTLEEMQNMSATLTNSQALSMVGKTVTVSTSSGTVEGVVDYVTMSGSKTYISVNGSKYQTSDVVAVLGEDYLAEIYGPQVTSASLTYDYDNPKSLSIDISLGEGSYAATGLYVAIGDQLVDGTYLSYNENTGKLTIAAGAFDGLESGETYDITFIFDNPAETVVSGTVSVTIKGTQPVTEDTDTSDDTVADDTTDNETTDVTDTDTTTDSEEIDNTTTEEQ